MRINYDFHLHSDFSGDCSTPASQMIGQAVRLGLEGLCFTEHEDPDAPPSDCDFSVDFAAYFSRMEELRGQYRGQLRILIGMEFGLMPHLPETLRALLAQRPFDFVIASQHFVGGKDPYYPSYFEGRSERACYEEYFRVMYENLLLFDPSSFDTLGHMDYIVRYGPGRGRDYTYAAYADYIDPILRYLIEHGKCLEVNTCGFRYGPGEPNPCTDVLRRYRELGGELITVGSDAHAPEYLCYGFERAAELLTGLGFRYYTVFERREASVMSFR